MSNYDPTDFLMGGSVPSLSFADKPIGHTYTGVILSQEVIQQTEFKTNMPQWWNPGQDRPSTTKLDGARPVLQLVITLQTDERTSSEDDGRRKDYVRGKDLKVLREAVRAAGMTQLKNGSRYWRKLVDLVDNGGSAPSKVCRFKVEAPAVNLDDFDAPVPAALTPAAVGAPNGAAHQTTPAVSVDDF